MKLSERDDLLTRLDERTNNIWHVVEQMQKHQEEQNGFIQDALSASSKNTAWRKCFVWLISLLVPGLGVLLAKIQGWW